MFLLIAAVISAIVTGFLYFTDKVMNGWALLGIFLGVWLVVWIIIRLFKGEGLDDLFSFLN